MADEIVVDIMANSCGVDYATAILDANYREVEGVSIPFASPRTLWKMKQTVREKDIPDRIFLKQLLAEEQERDAEADRKESGGLLETVRRWFRRSGKSE